MKRIFAILVASLAIAAVSCSKDQEEWTGGGGGGSKPAPTPVISGEGWAALADSTTYVLVSNYLDNAKGTFWSSVRDAEKDSYYLYWQQAHAMDVVLYSYKRIKSSNPELAAYYEEIFEKFFQNGANNYNHSHWSEGEYGRFFNDWTDDMAWLCLTLLHMTEFTGKEKYAQAAKDVYDKYIWTRSTRSEKGVCLPWTNHAEDVNNFNACTNTPSCLVAALLYQKYGEASYLKQAEDLYAFNINNKYDDERVENPALTYTQGTFGEACRVLYALTGNAEYRKEAGKVIKYAFYGGACTHNGLLRSEGDSNDQNIFKCVLIPYAVNYVLDKGMDATTVAQVKEKLLANAKKLNSNLNKDEYPSMFAAHYWGDRLEPRATVRMGCHASGASLIEGVARMTAAQ